MNADKFNLEGRTCSRNDCDRPADILWAGSYTDVSHGNYGYRCELHSIEERLAFARERAAAIPALELALARALGEGTQ